MPARRSPSPPPIRRTILLALALALAARPAAAAPPSAPCPAPNPCACTAAVLLPALARIPRALVPPAAWAPVADIIPVVAGLLSRPAPPPARERSFLREIEAATDAMFAAQFAAHAVAFNARDAWRRARPLLHQLTSGACERPPAPLPPGPTADVFAARFPPTRSVAGSLVSYDALRTVVRPYTRALLKTEALFSNFSRNDDVRDAVDAAVVFVQDVVAARFNDSVVAHKFANLHALELDAVFDNLVHGWYRARRMSERRIFLAIADQVEPLRKVSICHSAPVNPITCAICT